jgi:hypothetical protein
MAKGSDSKPLDLIVRNGTLVIPGVGQIKADAGIADYLPLKPAPAKHFEWLKSAQA